MQQLLINPASVFCSFEINCRGVDRGRDCAGDSGSCGNGFWFNCNRKKNNHKLVLKRAKFSSSTASNQNHVGPVSVQVCLKVEPPDRKIELLRW